MTDEPREVELKFSLDPAHSDEILDWLRQGRRVAADSQRSVYFDTPRGALRKSGLALRVRSDGHGWRQTLKSRAAEGGRQGRGEWEWPLDGPAPALDLARETPAAKVLGRRARLTPLFTVDVHRRRVTLRSPDAVIEACIDRGRAEAAEVSAAFEEVELELLAGDSSALFRLARDLTRRFGLPLSAVTKADRGFALLDGDGLQPCKFRPPRVTPAMTTGEAFRVLARAALEQIAWNAEVLRRAPLPEAVHQTRVGARRLRSTLSTFAKVVADEPSAEVREGLRRLAAELDPARNLDVFNEGAWRRQGAPEADEAPLAAARADAHARAQAAASGAELAHALVDALAWIEAGPWSARDARRPRLRDRPVTGFAAGTLGRMRRRVTKRFARPSRLDVESRHQMRIQAKRLRYAAEGFATLFEDHPRRRRRFLDRLERLVEVLGDLNDIDTARAMAGAFPHAEEILAREADRETELLSAADEAFRAFRAARPFWSDKT